jgi:hypothetical protein
VRPSRSVGSSPSRRRRPIRLGRAARVVTLADEMFTGPVNVFPEATRSASAIGDLATIIRRRAHTTASVVVRQSPWYGGKPTPTSFSAESVASARKSLRSSRVPSAERATSARSVRPRKAPGGAVEFHQGPAPSCQELAAVAARVARRGDGPGPPASCTLHSLYPPGSAGRGRRRISYEGARRGRRAVGSRPESSATATWPWRRQGNRA